MSTQGTKRSASSLTPDGEPEAKHNRVIDRKWSIMKYQARRRGLRMELDKPTFAELICGRCHYCGGAGDPVNGVDRVDNNQAYVPTNVVSCCSTCNYMKGQLSASEFIAQVFRIVLHCSQQAMAAAFGVNNV